MKIILNFCRRPVGIASLLAFLCYGYCLTPFFTLSPNSNEVDIDDKCRVDPANLDKCLYPYAASVAIDSGAGSWAEMPADYYWNRARILDPKSPFPSWNPFIGSGYPQILDGHHNLISPTRVFLRHFPGSTGRDSVLFARFFFWIFGIVLCLSLLNVSPFLQGLLGFVAAFAPYPSRVIDNVFLDTDLLLPWFLVLILMMKNFSRFPIKEILLSLFLGIFVGSLTFLQAQVIFLAATGLLSLVAMKTTKGRSLFLYGALCTGFLLMAPFWYPFLKELAFFVNNRGTSCIAERGYSGFWHAIFTSHSRFSTVASLGGLALFLLTFFRSPHKFLFIAWGCFAVLSVKGLPLLCYLPSLSVLRICRHILPHAQALFILCTGISINSLTLPSAKTKRTFIVLVVLSLGSIPFVVHWHLALYLLAGICLAVWVFQSKKPSLARVQLAAFLLVLPPFFLDSPLLEDLLTFRWAPETKPYPIVLPEGTTLGTLQRFSQKEDRRHFSPNGALFPNWSGTFGILDIRIVQALYPKYFYALNSTSGLTSLWFTDRQYGIKPDRFIETNNLNDTFSEEFQRVLILNRVSLFSFGGTVNFFPSEPTGPYAIDKCHEIAESPLRSVYRCPQVGPVGYFPSKVWGPLPDPGALSQFKSLPLTELQGIAIVSADSKQGGSKFAPAKGHVVSFERKGDSLSYDLNVEVEGLFVVADTWFPGWSVTIDEVSSPLFRTNIAFKSVNVPKGKHTVRFQFALENNLTQ